MAGMLDWAHGPDACAEATTAWRDAGGTHLALRVFDTLAARLGVPFSATPPWTSTWTPWPDSGTWWAAFPDQVE